jgi:hypothetical protein
MSLLSFSDFWLPHGWSLPFSVLLGTPVAVFGAFLTLWRGMQSNIYTQIGLIMLIGLAAKRDPHRGLRRTIRKGKPLLDARARGARCAFALFSDVVLSSSAVCRFGSPAAPAPLPVACSARP